MDEMILREIAYGTLTILDFCLLVILANYMYQSRGRWWYHSAGPSIALALSIFVFAQMMRSGLTWADYVIPPRGEDYHGLRNIALSVTPFIVMIGLTLLIRVLTAEGYRRLIIGACFLTAVGIPLLIHFISD